MLPVDEVSQSPMKGNPAGVANWCVTLVQAMEKRVQCGVTLRGRFRHACTPSNFLQ
jgi:hypothetical protein